MSTPLDRSLEDTRQLLFLLRAPAGLPDDSPSGRNYYLDGLYEFTLRYTDAFIHTLEAIIEACPYRPLEIQGIKDNVKDLLSEIKAAQWEAFEEHQELVDEKRRLV